MYYSNADVYNELKEMLRDELDKVVKKGELTSGSLDVIDKITHSIKSIETIMAMNGYSNKRDSMGRYSRGKNELMSELHNLMEESPDERTRQEFKRFITKMETL